MLASVAVKNHYNGARDPYAHFQNEITVDDVLKSRAGVPSAAPARLLPADRRRGRGAARAARSGRTSSPTSPVYVAGFGVATDHPYLHEKDQLHRDQGDAPRGAARVRDGGRRPRATSTAPRCTTASRSPRSSTSKTSASSRRATAAAPASRARPRSTGRIPVNTSRRAARQGPPDRRDRRRADHRVLVAAARRGRRTPGRDRATATRCSTTRAAAARACPSSTSSRTGTSVMTRDRICASSATTTASAASCSTGPRRRTRSTIAMRDGIVDAVREFRADPAVRAVLITGDGDAFCAGMDLSRVDRHAGRQARLRHPHDVARRCAPACRRSSASCGSSTSRRSPRSTAPRSDRARTSRSRATSCSCTPRTRFMWSFAKWGLVADAGGAYLLPRLVGLPRAKAMVMLGEGATGAEAVDLGLAYRCVDDADALLRRSRSRSRARLAAGPDPFARALEATAQRVVRDRPRALARARRPLPGARDDVARSRRGHGRVPREARRASSTARERSTRSAPNASSASRAYNVCVDDDDRGCCCAGSSDITETPGCVDAARRRHRLRRAPRSRRAPRAARGDRARSAASSSCSRSTRCTAGARGPTADADYHSVRIVYRTEIIGGDAARTRPTSAPIGRRGARAPSSRRCRSSSSAGSASRWRSAPAASTHGIPIRYAVRPWRGSSRSSCSRSASRTSEIDGDDVKVRMGWAFRTTFARGDVMAGREPPAGGERRRARLEGPLARERRAPPDRGRSALRARARARCSASACTCASCS